MQGLSEEAAAKSKFKFVSTSSPAVRQQWQPLRLAFTDRSGGSRLARTEWRYLPESLVNAGALFSYAWPQLLGFPPRRCQITVSDWTRYALFCVGVRPV
jgi:hypothetical protein